jgi:putative ABC transport system permease protein
MSLINRFLNLLRRRQLESELDEEQRFHLEARAGDNIRAGMNPRQAREDARRRFGNQTLSKERARESDLFAPLETVAQDLWYAIRSLHRNPAFTAAAILVLALGIGANTAIFTVVNGVLLRPLPFPEPERLFLITYEPRQPVFSFGPSLTDHHYLHFRKHDQQFENVTSFSTYPVALTRAGDPVRLVAAAVTPEFLNVLKAAPAAGRGFLPNEGRERVHVAILGDKLWRGRFRSDPEILGRSITLDGVAHTVIGIMPPGFSFPQNAELWTPMEIQLQPNNSYSRPVIGRLRPGVTPEQAQAALEAIAARSPLGHGERRSELTPRILPLLDVMTADIRKALFVFMGAVAFVLLIACANVANLLLMRAASRRHEIGIRAALGARRRRLIRQLLTESTVVSLAGGTAGVLFAFWAVPVLLALAPEGTIPRADEIRLDGWVLAFTAALSVLTGIAFGLAPAFQSTRCALRESLSEGARTLTGTSERLRSALVVAEIALALVLLTGAGLLLRSFWRMHSVDPGFRADHVLTATVELPDARYRTVTERRAFHQRTLAMLAATPGVVTAGAVNWIPLGRGLIRGDFQLDGGRQRPRGYIVDKPVVSPVYFRTMGIRVLAGREFEASDNAVAPGVVIVSRSVAHTLWPAGDAIGRRIALTDKPTPKDWLTIVGVVDDVRQNGLTATPSPAIYQPYLQASQPFFLAHMTFVVRTAADPATVASGLRAALREIDPDLPAQSIATMQDVIAGTTAEPRFQSRLLGAFAVLAVLLAAIGIYGVLACSVAERRREIGIRMALGAGERDVVRMVLRRTMLLAGIGVVLGTAGALVLTRLLEKFLYEIRPTDPITFVTVAAILLGVAVIAGLLPARRASSVDPMATLRHG